MREPVSKPVVSEKAVIPEEAGTQSTLKTLDSRLHGNDKKRQITKTFDFEKGSTQIKPHFTHRVILITYTIIEVLNSADYKGP